MCVRGVYVEAAIILSGPCDIFAMKGGIMPEAIAHVAGMFGGASGIFKTLKEGANAIREAKNLELYERMLAVYGDVMELVEKNRELVEENALLKEQLKIKDQLRFDKGYNCYWRFEGDKQEGPYCTVCWDVDRKLVRMRAYQKHIGGQDYTCDYCGRHRVRQ